MARTGSSVSLRRLEAQRKQESDIIYTTHGSVVWKRDIRPVGRGGFGEVYREECVQGHSRGALRAVKAIQKPNSMMVSKTDYSKELEAIARFPQPQVRKCCLQETYHLG